MCEVRCELKLKSPSNRTSFISVERTEGYVFIPVGLSVYLSVCLSVCLTFSNIVDKREKGFSWNFLEWNKEYSGILWGRLFHGWLDFFTFIKLCGGGLRYRGACGLYLY